MTNSPFGTDETAHLYGDGHMKRLDGGFESMLISANCPLWRVTA